MPHTILLIDPDVFLSDIYADALRKEGFVVQQAATGHEGMTAAIEGPDLIVLDVMMPRMAAFEILERLRASASATVLPIVVMTSLAHRRDIERCQRLGISGYFVKTHHMPHDLVGGVKQTLSHH